MADHQNGDWHNANGHGLAFRPPTVDEALPLSPFTSVVPFAPEIIPFPRAEPPTPPTTLSADQQAAARKAVEILNEEIKGPTSTAQHLESTLRELRELLGNPHEMTEFRFKPTAQLATPPPDSPGEQTKRDRPTKAPTLSPFASQLFQQIDVHYLPETAASPYPPKVKQETPRTANNPPAAPVPRQPVAPSPNHIAHAQNGASHYPPSTPTSSASSVPQRSGPAVVVKPLPSSARREEYRRYDHVKASDDSLPQQREDRQQDSGLSMLRPHEREKAEQKIEQLHKFVDRLCDEKADADTSDDFDKIVGLDADLTVLSSDTLGHLYNKVMVVCATGCFSSVSVDVILQLQSLCEPSIDAADQSSLFSQGELDGWDEDIRVADAGLRAAKLALTSMLEGCEDRRITTEDLIEKITNGVKRVLEQCVFPVIESRSTGQSPELFVRASSLKEKLSSLLRLCTSVMQLLADAISRLPLSHTSLNPIEHLALSLLSQQNCDSEKDSVFGLQRFETLRQAGMEVLVRIFASHADRQQYILEQILSNLEKLSDKSKNARSFKSAHDPPIMTVSALFMRFVQVAATYNQNQYSKLDAANPQHDSADEEDSDSSRETSSSRKPKPGAKIQESTKSRARAPMTNASSIAARIANTLSQRALNVSKTGEKPFRYLLDMFVADTCSVLGSPEWPAAPLLLGRLLLHMLHLLKGTTNREMALSLLGAMGCGIIDFKLRMKQLKRDLDVSQSDLSAKLERWTADAMDKGMHPKDLLALKGPYRMVIESLADFLRVQGNQEDPHLQSVRGCYLALWLDSVATKPQGQGEDEPNDQVMSELEVRLESMVLDSKWLSREYNFQAVTAPQSQLAAGIITLQQPFCQYYEHIVNTMLQQMQTQDTAVKVKSGAIKSIESFLDKDPQALPEKSIMGVISLLHDNSPLVRTDAVSLVSKCLKRNPNLERHFLHSVLGLTIDPSNGPKKKAINLLKDLYSETKTNQHKLDISASLLPPSQDHEESVADLARQTLEGIWLGTPNADGRVDEHRLKLHRQQRASVLVETVQRIQGQAEHLAAFESFFANALAKKASNAAKNASICSELVADMVEGVISPETLGANCSQVHVLTTLSILARVRPGLITQDQLQLLKLYIKNPATSDDLAILRPTATIFRVVLPHMPYLQSTFADEVWKLLTATLSKLASLAGRGNAAGKSTLADVVQCTWMMVPLATGGVNLLSTIVSSVMVQLSPFSSSTHRITPAEENRISSYLVLLGTLGKFFNFDNDKDADVFRTKLSDMIQKHLVLKKATSDQLKGLLNLGTKAPSVILLDTVRPFAKQPWSLTIREHALGSVGEICQGAPSLFMRVDVQKMFQLVFTNDVSSLKQVALTQFHDFFIVAEKPTDTSNDTNEDSVQVGRLGTTFIAGEGQVTTNFLARHLLSEIVNIALTHDNELAHLATCIIASISRQGLVHPKECGPALIALGSSSNPQIAEIAVTEHRKIHEQHESMFEKEYMAAITMAFEYQRTVFNDTHGMVASTYKPKLLHVFNALKGGQRKTLKKFIVNLCKHMDFELTSLEGNAAGSTAVLFARFCLENMALLDAVKLEDVSLMLNALESIVLKNTGPSVGVAIETELPKSGTIGPAADTVLPAEPMPQQQQEVANGTDAVLEPPASRDMDQRKETLSDARLVQVTQACIILQMMWETRSFIRKAYNLGNLTGRIAQKDFQKPAQRNNLISGKELWERLEPILDSMGSRETMMQRCYNFAELLEVDKDAQLGDDDGDGNDGDDMGYATPDEGGEELAVPTSGRGRKRKSSVPNGNTPKKARGRPAGGKNKKQNSRTPDLDGWN